MGSEFGLLGLGTYFRQEAARVAQQQPLAHALRQLPQQPHGLQERQPSGGDEPIPQRLDLGAVKPAQHAPLYDEQSKYDHIRFEFN